MLVPTVLAKIYGVDGGMRVFSVGFCFAGMGSLINIATISILLDSFSYEGLCIVYTVLNFIALIYLIVLYKFKKITCCDLS